MNIDNLPPMKLPAWLASLLPLLLIPTGIRAGTTYFYTPQSISSMLPCYADGDAPVHQLNMSSFGCTSSAMSTSVTGWNLGSFTGTTSPSPVGSWQLGIAADSYGSTAVQANNDDSGTSIEGVMNNTYTIPGGSGYNGNLANMQVEYKWNYSDDLMPWQYSTSKFCFSCYLQIPSSYFAGGIGYVLPSCLFADQNGKLLWIQMQIYDCRGVNSSGIHEFVGFAGGDAFANTMYEPGAQYSSMESGSNESTGSTWSGMKWYGSTINAAQLLKMIDACNAAGAGLSTNTAGYHLLSISVQDEIATGGGNGWLPFSVDQIWCYETY